VNNGIAICINGPTPSACNPEVLFKLEFTRGSFPINKMAPKSVLITGCSSGIGHALAREFKSKGLRVFATARKTESIVDLAELGIETLSLEVNDIDSIKALHEEITKRTGGSLDILVNNAGRNYTVPALHVEIDEIRQTFETNVFSVMRICQKFAPLLINAKGTIVQIGSVAAIIPYVFGSVYNASKSALHGYTTTLRVELAQFDVRVVTVITGGVKSNIARTNRLLPEDSIYLPVQDEYAARLKHSQSAGIPNEDYARTVVKQVLHKPRKDTIWAGGKSTLVWFASSFFPRWVMVSASICPSALKSLPTDNLQDYVVTRIFKLYKLRGTFTKKNN
jgi:1-acylglycerone phosphate reductase